MAEGHLRGETAHVGQRVAKHRVDHCAFYSLYLVRATRAALMPLTQVPLSLALHYESSPGSHTVDPATSEKPHLVETGAIAFSHQLTLGELEDRA